MTKSAAVRAAVAEGVEKPSDGVTYVKEKFGLDVTAQQFSLIKSQSKKKAESPAPRTKAVPTTNGDPSVLARQVKTLVQAYGADAVKKMTDVFSD
jgi:hypothetical protein